MPSDSYNFVGNGRGGYEKVETLVWVGEGNGTYCKEEMQGLATPSAGGRRSTCYIAVMVSLLCIGAACMLSSVLTGPADESVQSEGFQNAASGNASTLPHLPPNLAPLPEVTAAPAAATSIVPAAASASAQFDCNNGDAQEATWPREQKVWCCRNTGEGCPTLDCEAGYSDWERGWSPGKKKWCCAHENRGCAQATPGTAIGTSSATLPPAEFDCTAQYSSWQQGWSGEKQTWCCWHVGRGCKDQPQQVQM
mmetsp:Transcript_61997/g.159989  ORF Transcript_61997/g.159989 Transcript_61997/m.159989 type:complete len:251 (+) Transcript_61997:547-1299(+)